MRRQETIRHGRHLLRNHRLLARQIVPGSIAGADDEQHGQHRKTNRRAFLDDREVGWQVHRTLDRNRTGKMIGRHHLLGVQPDMRCVGAQEGRDVSRTGQLVEAPFLYGFEMGTTNAQAFFDIRQAEATRLTLVAKQATDRATRGGLAFKRTPIDLIRHDVPCKSPLTGF